MPIQKYFFSPLKALKLFILVAAIAYHPVNGLESRKLDEATGDQGLKCTTPACIQSPPPPPPPPPSPPPPCPPPPTPPPPPKKPPTQYCPPPPPTQCCQPSSIIYFPGPPGNLYPIDNDYSSAIKKISSNLPLLVASGILGLLALW